MSIQSKSLPDIRKVGKATSVNPVALFLSAKPSQRDYGVVWLAPAIDRIRAVEAGVPSEFLTALATEMDVPQNTLYGWVGIAPVIVKRKLNSRKPLNLNDGERALGIARLVGQVETLIRASGDKNEFDAKRWIAQWLGQPNPALGGQPPGRYMNTAAGCSMVSDLISLAAGGGFA